MNRKATCFVLARRCGRRTPGFPTELQRMPGRFVHRIAAIALGIAMLATPAIAAPMGGCAGTCCQLASADVTPTAVESSNCCSSSSLSVETACSATDGAALRCHLCCGNSPVVPQNVQPSRDVRLDLSAESGLCAGPFVAPLPDASHLYWLAAAVEGPFWSASDGPSRQAFLCRFTV